MTASAPVHVQTLLPLVEELPPGLDPWNAAMAFADRPHLLFLDSAAPHSPRGRYSYVMAEPTQALTSLADAPALGTARTVVGLPPFQGGYAGVIHYTYGRRLERIPRNAHDDFPLPDLAIFRYDWVLAFDHIQRRAWAIAHGSPGLPPGQRWEQARQKISELRSKLAAARPPLPPLPRNPTRVPAWNFPLENVEGVSSNFDRAGYLKAVQRAIDYIHAGDCFQINLSQRLHTRLIDHPLEIYSRLRERNAAPFAAYFDAGAYQLLSASPERFLQVTPTREMITRPIKGTRPRGETPEDDARLVQDLTTNPKDRAENVMIVDLLRNDLGRVAEFGSMSVPKVCELESFPFVHHLVSEVRGQLRPECSVWDLMQAAFPGGSITGAPKVRAMEIIAELEPTERGPYCGSLGFWGFDGSCDTNILIRTFTATGGYLLFPVGGGIVADSVPEREYAETLHKAVGLLRALHP